MKVLKLIGSNLLVLLLLLLGMNLAVITFTELYRVLRNQPHQHAKAHLCATHVHWDWSATHFKEFSQLPTQYSAYEGWRRLPYQGKTIRIDSNGYRVTPNTSKTDSAITIVFLGGSTMWGTGVTDDFTIPNLVAKQIKNVNVVNLAESGHKAYQQHIALQLAIAKGLKPDIIISYDGVNELNGLTNQNDVYDHARADQMRAILANGDEFSTRNLHFESIFWSPLQQFIQKLKSKPLMKVDTSKERCMNAAQFLHQTWHMNRTLATQLDAQFIAVLQPNLATGNPDTSCAQPKQYPLRKLGYPYLYNAMEQTLHQDTTLNWYDFTAIFDEKAPYYFDFCHVNPEGNQVIADSLVQILMKHQTKH